MPTLTVGHENGHDIEIYFEDHGTGQPVVLIHGFPLDGRSWDKQARALLGAGYRVISYDRRGFGMSSNTTIGFDYDTFADDLAALLDHLALRDAVLVGFSMGTGEVTRYLARHGSGRVTKAVLMAAVPPFLLRTPDNPEGVEGSVFEGIKAAIADDRPAYFKQFLDDFFNVDVLGGTRISEQAWQAAFVMALQAGAFATYAAVDSWLTDFRADLGAIDVPVLLIHGDADRILPYAATAARLPGMIADLQVVTVAGGPHNIAWTHPEVVNPALLEFLKS
ncbi:alpha/beta fold hydrolase [Nocardia nova]|uniref:alpha/beta fold hydrolase n=1 Tax=Nocardia nova TaxID=37330 RepID=UPI0018934D18|nr:alpha/beta hydrolase [Nocardia nova]MBF6148125.1 alpha/beta hydrolase [Nocardia nova]MDN2502340.1 alpha/beta hydrolase [Nocardia nova]